MTVIRAAVFDLDGKLIDSNWVRLQSWRGALRILGLEFRDQEVIDRLGLRTVDIARQVLTRYGEPTIGKLVELKTQLYENAWRLDVKPRYGALEMLQNMKTRGVRSAQSDFKDEPDYRLRSLYESKQINWPERDRKQ